MQNANRESKPCRRWELSTSSAALNFLVNLSTEESLELKAYLEDYAKDLVNDKNMTEKDARIQVLNEFNVKEMMELTKNKKLISFKDHSYLLGYAVTFILLCVLLSILCSITDWSTIGISLISVLACYATGFVGM